MSVEAGSLGGAEVVSGGHLAGAGGPWSDLSPHPIRRWIARSFDAYITTGVIFVALAAPWVVFGTSEWRFMPAGVFALVYLVPPLRGLAAAVLNAAILSRTSITPGKWLCGVRIVRKDGAPLTFNVALKRELGGFMLGCGLYIPLLSLIATGRSFFALRKVGATRWDEDHDLVAVQRPNSAGQFIVALVAFTVVVTAVLAFAGFAESLGAEQGSIAG